MEQNIGILFVAIGLLSASIGILEKNYMFGVDSYVDKFNKKYNVNIDKATYCRFEGIQRIKTAMRLLILEVVYFLFVKIHYKINIDLKHSLFKNYI